LLEVFVATNIAACFRNVKLVERLHDLAYYDPLTLLPNRLQFIADLEAAACSRPDLTPSLR
jgi:GGDEF domain-containing protein